MKRIIFALAIAVSAIGILGSQPAGATGAPYCSSQVEAPNVAATEAIDVASYDHGYCKPIPPATQTDHNCGTPGYITIPEHYDRKIDYFIDDVEVDEGNHDQALGATVKVTAEVAGDGNNVLDYNQTFTFSTPDCTPTTQPPTTQPPTTVLVPGPQGPQGPAGPSGPQGPAGAPGVVTVAQPARPVVATPTFTG